MNTFREDRVAEIRTIVVNAQAKLKQLDSTYTSVFISEL